ncbi:XdhC/CoxI family protein [Sporolactobacillus shoreae]|uniref:XdhC/CoxI family protein n=1 Tax=Sporolactobacillus shoreae TaxID=1465501 RepID=A0A4Z0GRF5_9BACL|nr:XdhC/CoxI family protein [Sporolactobacillus shoreae]TGA99899.1 XdhC/CoxI family protein [Sporolactobacillus shoreae]
MNDFYRALSKVKQRSGNKFAMATIIHIDGSAYRHTGARMLIDEQGNRYGTISAGCLEEDLNYHAQEVIQSSKTQTLSYDMRSIDDLGWGQGAGCNGNIEIYLEPVSWENTPEWNEIYKLLDQRKSVVSVRCIGGKFKDKVFHLYYPNGSTVNHIDDHEISKSLSSDLETFLKSGQKIGFVKIPSLESDFLFEYYKPREVMYVFGAGPDAIPLVRLASELDFWVTVIDPRGSLNTDHNFPDAEARILEHPDDYFSHAEIKDNSYVLVMTHNFKWDQQVMTHFLTTGSAVPKYLGFLGPHRRTVRLNSGKEVPDWVRSPIGLNIDAEGPEEISVSIMAELIQLKNETSSQKELIK